MTEEKDTEMASSSELFPMPTLPVDFPEIKAIPTEMLEQLEINQTALDEFVSNMEIVAKYKKQAVELDEKKTKMASKNVSEKARVDFLREECATVASELKEVKSRAEKSFAERDAMMSKYTPKNLVLNLDNLAASTDTETERLMSEFTSLDAAKASILQQRIVHHKARALSDLISSHSTARVGQSPRHNMK